MQTLFQDLRYSLRSLLKTPVFTTVAILTLALGIGANSAIFSVVNSVVLKPLPYETPSQLLFITSAFPTMGFMDFWMSAPEYRELQEWNESFSSIGAFNTGEVSLNGGDAPLRVAAGFATTELFQTLGVGARLGRWYTAEEDIAGAPPVVVLTWELWERAFGAREDLIGESIDVNGQLCTVIGVMPPKFDVDNSGAEIWIPLALDPANPRPRSNHFLYAVGRLKTGVTPERAQNELTSLISRWEELGAGHSPSADGHPIQYKELQEEVVGDARPALLVLLAAVGFVLLIACANVGNLLLARAESRQKEIAIRTALGAGRGRLIRQFLTESLVLALVGSVVGLAAATWGLQALLAVHPDSIPRVAEIGLDGTVLMFTLGVALVAGVLFGLAPLMHLTMRSVSTALREGGLRTTAGSARLVLRRGLVVTELALAVVLAVGAGLMLRSFAALQDVNPGFQPEGVLTFRLYLPPGKYPTPLSETQFLEDLTARLRSVPGVSSLTSMSGLPPNRRINANDMDFEGLERVPDGPPHNIDYWQFVMPDYLSTMGIRVVEGRGFEATDAEGTVPVTLVNETTARTYWPGESPLGRRLRPGGSQKWFTIVGVVEDVKQGGLEEPTGTETYFYYPQVAGALNYAPRTMNVALRTSVPPMSIASVVRETVWGIDAALPVADLQPFENVMADAVARPRFLTLILLIFGAVALTLAAVGTYGVMAYTVEERSHEMGIRMALGARSGRVIQLVLSQGMKVAAVGLGIGLVGAFGLTKFMSSMLYGVGTTDLATFLAVPLVLVGVSVVACLIPAHRATRVDPIEVLRSE